MIILKLIALILGLAFTIFGYFIFFRKKYSLINGFDDDYKAGRKNENYAKHVGLIELTVGIVLLCASVILFIFT